MADFQKVAVRQAVQMIRNWGGCFAADMVGLGKSYIGAAVVKHFERTNLNPNALHDDIDVIYSGDKSRERLIGRFAPKANPWFKFHSGETELFTVIATDVLSEGLNLQDCDRRIPPNLSGYPTCVTGFAQDRGMIKKAYSPFLGQGIINNCYY